MTIHPAVRLLVPAGLFAILVAAPRGRRDPAADPGPAPVLEPQPEAVPDVPLSELYHELPAPGAKVTVVEFSDFGCPYCGRFSLETFPQLRKEYVETGKVRWRFVPFSLGIFPNGAEAMQAATCVAEQGEDAFWKMHDILFATQAEWKGSRAPRELFRGYARKVGADIAAFDACYAGRRAEDRVAAATALAHRSGVRSTPSFFVGGTLIQGALPIEQFRLVLDRVTR